MCHLHGLILIFQIIHNSTSTLLHFYSSPSKPLNPPFISLSSISHTYISLPNLSLKTRLFSFKSFLFTCCFFFSKYFLYIPLLAADMAVVAQLSPSSYTETTRLSSSQLSLSSTHLSSLRRRAFRPIIGPRNPTISCSVK